MKTLNTRHRTVTVWPLFILLCVGCTDLALVDPELETRPTAAPFTITSTLHPTSSIGAVTLTRLAGTFEATGFIQDTGSVHDVLDSPESLQARSNIHGMKTLQGARGTITIEYYAGLNTTNQDEIHVYGGFVIVAATGVYTGLEGSGKINRTVAAGSSLRDITQELHGEGYYRE